MYDIEYRRSALKEIKKLDKQIRQEIILQIEICAENPLKGKHLKGVLSGYLSYDFTYKSASYRIIYTINRSARVMTIEMAGTRENIYNAFKRKL